MPASLGATSNETPIGRAVSSPIAPLLTGAQTGAFDMPGLSRAVAHLIDQGGGNYTVTLGMQPAELGHVQAVMSLTGNDLHVTITPQTTEAHQAIANSLGQLKSELTQNGLTVSLTVLDSGARGGGGRRTPSPYRHETTESIDTATGVVEATPLQMGGQIHLVL